MKKNILLIILFYSICYSQQSKDSLTFSSKYYSDKYLINSFNKQLNTNFYSINFKHSINYNKFFIGFNEQFNSTIVSTNLKNIKDEHTLNSLSLYTLNDKTKIGFYFNNNIYNDDRNIGLNKASILNSIFLVDYSPLTKINIVPFLGFEQNNQLNEKDNGFVYGFETNTDDFNLGEFEINSVIKFKNEDISPKKNTLRLLNFDLTNYFDENFSNIISANYLQQRRDFYFVADKFTSEEFNIVNNIQSRIESNYNIQERIKLLQPYSPFSFDIIGRISFRNIDRSTKFISFKNISNLNYDTKINELRLEFSSLIEYRENDYNLSFRFSFTEKDEKHLPKKYDGISQIIFDDKKIIEEQKNNTSQLANLSLSGSFLLTDKNIFSFSIFHRKLKYDTPSNINFDDRDELLSIGSLNFTHKFNYFFKAFINLEGSINKMVYIFSERSANNNIKRTIRLSSGGIFSNQLFTSKNSAEVSANYTVFDYEELNPNYKSYSFRQFSFRDSTKITLTKIAGINLNGYLKISEQGNFNWNKFSEAPQRHLIEEFLHNSFFYNYSFIEFNFGVKYYSLKTFSFISQKDKKLLSKYSSIGPTIDISINLVEKLDLKIFSWYEFINDETNKKREMTNLDLRLSYKF
ncbi:MAG: hypothetical protein N2321_06865 [Melioribacteraceae bacterium]|nr:hypothetical protein [Melioribacteraceae bacterium]